MYSFGDLHGRVCPLWTPAQVAQRLPGVARQVEKLPGGDVESGSPPPEAAALAGLHKLCAATCWHNRSVQTLGNSKLKLGVSDHSAVAMDCCTPLVRTNTTPAAVGGTLLQQEQHGWAPLYAPVWEHMLTDEPSGPDSITGEDGRGALEDEGKPFGECGCLSYPWPVHDDKPPRLCKRNEWFGEISIATLFIVTLLHQARAASAT
jgi:hypothetical protein